MGELRVVRLRASTALSAKADNKTGNVAVQLGLSILFERLLLIFASEPAWRLSKD